MSAAVPMVSKQGDFTVYAGQALVVPLQVENADGTIVSLVGRSFRISAYRRGDRVDLAHMLASVVGDTATMALTGAQTEALFVAQAERVPAQLDPEKEEPVTLAVEIVELLSDGSVDVVIDGLLTVKVRSNVTGATPSTVTATGGVATLLWKVDRSVVARDRGAPGLPAPQVLFAAGIIDAPTVEAMAVWQRAPAVEAAAAASEIATLAQEQGQFAQEQAEAAQEVVTAATAILAARDGAVSAAGEAVDARVAVQPVITDLALGASSKLAAVASDLLSGASKVAAVAADLALGAASKIAKVAADLALGASSKVAAVGTDLLAGSSKVITVGTDLLLGAAGKIYTVAADLGLGSAASFIMRAPQAAIDAAAAQAATQTLFNTSSALLPTSLLATESGYRFAITDVNRRAALLIGLDGSVLIPRYWPGSIGTTALADGSVTNSKIAPASLGRDRLSAAVTGGLAIVTSSAESGYAFSIIDSAGRHALAIRSSGAVVIPRPELGAGVVTYANLATTVQTALAKAMPAESGYLFAVADAAGRIGFGIKPDGSITAKITAVTGQFVNEANLSTALQRQVLPKPTDMVEVASDPWRSARADMPVRTNVDGSLWAGLPRSFTPGLYGINSSGTSLDFRRTAGLKITGKRYCGGLAIGATAAVTYRGTFNASAPTAATPALGDYLEFTGAAATTHGSYTYMIGDLAVYDGAAWVKQAGPAPLDASANFRSREPGDWWIVTSAGTFMGTVYAVGDRIVYLGFQSLSGTGRAMWTKGDYATRGDFFYRGEFAPSGGLPASPADGEVYQASAAGTAGSFTFAIGDYLVRDAGVWGQVATETIRTVAAGAFLSLPCHSGMANEWEVRRTDKGNSRAPVAIKGYRQNAPRRHVDSLLLLSDSMFGASGIGNMVLTKTRRSGVVLPYGGGTSRDVMTMLESFVLGADPYRGWVHVLWHGQNNSPGAANDAASIQIKEAALRMAELIGARDRRALFLSIMGSRQSAGWNGSRITYPNLEPAFAKTGGYYDLERWYAATFPGQFLNTRQVFLAAATSALKDPLFPGMTELQVATTYGIIPFGFYAMATSIPVSPNNLVYAGTWTSASLPTGGAANDYYIRVGGGTIGNLLINVAGSWVEWSGYDTVHLSPAGAEALSTAIAAFLTNAFF